VFHVSSLAKESVEYRWLRFSVVLIFSTLDSRRNLNMTIVETIHVRLPYGWSKH